MEIFKIAFTGGPCALKTKTINAITEKLTKDGYHVIIVPETAEELIKNGILPHKNKEHTLRFQELVLERQKHKENEADKYAKLLNELNTDILKDKKAIIILYDRSIPDNRAYLSFQEYNNLLEKYSINELEEIDKFDLTIDLVSTAKLKPELYALNGIRYENPEEAAYKDVLTSSAWLMHRNLKVIKPTDTEQEKIDIVLTHIYNLLYRRDLQTNRSYFIDEDKTDFSKYNDDNSRRIKITSFNLKTYSGTYFNLYKREYRGHVSYIKRTTSPKYFNQSFVIDDLPIKFNEFIELLSSNTINSQSIKNIQYCIDNGDYYNFETTSEGLRLWTELDEQSIPKNIILKRTLKK